MAAPGTTRRRIVDELKRTAPATAADLAAVAGVTATAVRQHLEALEAGGLVEAAPAPPTGGRGRPSTEWSLTELAQELFPDRHADLTIELIDAIRATAGDAGLDAVIARRTDRQRHTYRAVVDDADDLVGRIEALADIRSREGYMAEVAPDGDGYVLTEHHCPICDAAATCQGLCTAELGLFRDVLGPAATVERTEHLLRGGTRCSYRITPVTIG